MDILGKSTRGNHRSPLWSLARNLANTRWPVLAERFDLQLAQGGPALVELKVHRNALIIVVAAY